MVPSGTPILYGSEDSVFAKRVAGNQELVKPRSVTKIHERRQCFQSISQSSFDCDTVPK